MFAIKTQNKNIVNLDNWNGVRVNPQKAGKYQLVAFNQYNTGNPRQTEIEIGSYDSHEAAQNALEDLYQSIVNGGHWWRAP